MDISTQQRILYAIAGSCLLGTVAAVYWSTTGVREFVIPPTATKNRIAAVEDPIVAKAILSDANLTGALRGPLYDPPPPVAKPRVELPPAAKPTPPPKPQLDLTLVGTIIDAGQSLAIIADATGKFDVKGIGEALELSPEGVRIDQIESEQITLQYQGNESTIRLDKNKQPANEGKRANNRRRNP